ncbi:DUF6055 domain-containing protein [Saccharicrinis sp. FJH2]|uniref:DUF6055 domain-containing protein n=1 Tax=Saccharicrinis sp. FJH65 TaxID=3344659 RepID=UPI0035F32D9D
MRYTGIKILILFLLVLGIIPLNAETQEKAIYKPSSFGNMDLNNESSQWCYQRSVESENFIIFWEAGYGSNPKTLANTDYRVNTDAVLAIAEDGFAMYRDSMKFIIEGQSKTDQYKMIILLFYTTDWIASGSGVDDMIGLLNLSAWAAQALGVTVAHEVGHCFQYQVHCDGFPGGWRYGFGSNGSGGNCWWEQCAQWQAFKVFPDQQFSDYRFSEYLNNTYRNILHESPRYANYFIQDYWTYLHGFDFIGYLWRESQYPEDPVEAYKRLTNTSQSEFNDEMYDRAARFVTWDIPVLRDRGKNYITSRSSNTVSPSDDGYLIIDPNECLENYGYNTFRLNVPDAGEPVTVFFEGKAGSDGYRNVKNKAYAGWRYGLVGLNADGSRFYSPMKSPSYLGSLDNPKDTLTVLCPENCTKLWMVVTGAPSQHWRHPWDDDDSNDEQWPYQVKFANTNLYGTFNFTEEDVPHDATITQHVRMIPFVGSANPYPSTPVQPNMETICKAFCLNLSDVKAAFGSTIKYCAINPDGSKNYTSTANAPGHWFGKSGNVTSWGNSSYIFSELNSGTLTFNIGQYPNLCKEGDEFTIKQGLVYTPAGGSPVTVTFVFNILVTSDITAGIDEKQANQPDSPVLNNHVSDYIVLNKSYEKVIIYNMNGQVIKSASNTSRINSADLASGVYLVYVNGMTEKVVKL